MQIIDLSFMLKENVFCLTSYIVFWFYKDSCYFEEKDFQGRQTYDFDNLMILTLTRIISKSVKHFAS